MIKEKMIFICLGVIRHVRSVSHGLSGGNVRSRSNVAISLDSMLLVGERQLTPKEVAILTNMFPFAISCLIDDCELERSQDAVDDDYCAKAIDKTLRGDNSGQPPSSPYVDSGLSERDS
ncbi:hypothetical protein [Massilia frigida]|uniref:hypothetical protein n=1 Tax=Massilia frigida TaxID=2609281 RepID=UPI00141F01F6|nr:hypothetical protein [Massilia frigida]